MSRSTITPLRFGRCRVTSQLADSHVYVFKRSVLDLLPLVPELKSIKKDLIPFLCSLQYSRTRRNKFSHSTSLPSGQPRIYFRQFSLLRKGPPPSRMSRTRARLVSLLHCSIRPRKNLTFVPCKQQLMLEREHRQIQNGMCGMTKGVQLKAPVKGR